MHHSVSLNFHRQRLSIHNSGLIKLLIYEAYHSATVKSSFLRRFSVSAGLKDEVPQVRMRTQADDSHRSYLYGWPQSQLDGRPSYIC